MSLLREQFTVIFFLLDKKLDIDILKVSEAYCGKGMVMKRWRPRAKGRAGRINKFFTNVTIKVTEVQEEGKSKVGNIIRKFELGNVINIRSRFLSGGQQRRLSVGMAMVKNTKILVLDEPFSQLDPMAIKMIQQIIVSLQMLERITVSISDHSYRDLLNVCDSSMILSEGKIVAKGSKAELLRNEKAIANYFGKGL